MSGYYNNRWQPPAAPGNPVSYEDWRDMQGQHGRFSSAAAQQFDQQAAYRQGPRQPSAPQQFDRFGQPVPPTRAASPLSATRNALGDIQAIATRETLSPEARGAAFRKAVDALDQIPADRSDLRIGPITMLIDHLPHTAPVVVLQASNAKLRTAIMGLMPKQKLQALSHWAQVLPRVWEDVARKMLATLQEIRQATPTEVPGDEELSSRGLELHFAVGAAATRLNDPHYRGYAGRIDTTYGTPGSRAEDLIW